jgi:hypothetical protein
VDVPPLPAHVRQPARDERREPLQDQQDDGEFAGNLPAALRCADSGGDGGHGGISIDSAGGGFANAYRMMVNRRAHCQNASGRSGGLALPERPIRFAECRQNLRLPLGFKCFHLLSTVPDDSIAALA